MFENILGNKVSVDRKLDRVQKLANTYTTTKIDATMFSLQQLLSSEEIVVNEKAFTEIKKFIGKEIALSYGLGYMKGTEQKKLYSSTGEELL